MSGPASPHPATMATRPLPSGQIAPSILAADFTQLGHQIAANRETTTARPCGWDRALPRPRRMADMTAR